MPCMEPSIERPHWITTTPTGVTPVHDTKNLSFRLLGCLFHRQLESKKTVSVEIVGVCFEQSILVHQSMASRMALVAIMVGWSFGLLTSSQTDGRHDHTMRGPRVVGGKGYEGGGSRMELRAASVPIKHRMPASNQTARPTLGCALWWARWCNILDYGWRLRQH